MLPGNVGGAVATFLLIIHGLLAVALLGAVTHQAFAVLWPTTSKASSWARFRAVPAAPYVNMIIVLYVVTAVLGGVIYTVYRVDVRELLEQLSIRSTVGLFEIKEHVSAIGIGLLPAYWYYWRDGGVHPVTRKALTALVAGTVWFGFLVGHIVNNVKGFGL